MKIFINLYKILNTKQRIGGVFQLLLMLISMLLELLSIGMLIPIMEVISTDNIRIKYPFLVSILYNIGNPNKQSLLIYVMLLFISIYAFKMLFMTLVTHINYKYVFSLQIYFSEKLFKGYMNHSVAFHLEKNSAQLIQNTINLVANTTAVFVTIILILTEIITTLAVIILLIRFQPMAVVFICTIFIPFLLIFQIVTKKKITRLGSEYIYHEGKRIQYLQQSLSSLKDIKILGRESYFSNQYNLENTKSAFAYQHQQTLQALPRFYLEFLAIVSIGLLVINMVHEGKEFSIILSTLGLFGGAAYRLMPSLNRISGSFQTLRFSYPVIDTIKKEFESIDNNINTKNKNSDQIIFNKLIQIKNVYFKYKNSENLSLNNINIEIPLGTSIGIIGTTGSGKSTLVDVLLGILKPDKGSIIVDDKNIESNLRSWQDQIGYIPQTINLIDDTLKKNIAFGVRDEDINYIQLENAIKSSQLEKVIQKLEFGIDTMIGEKGVRLSGGERQRIGIARALYNNPKILVLDEATSSLDVKTEEDVMASIRNLLNDNMTIVIVAHRLSTIKQCNQVYEMNNGISKVVYNNHN